MGGRGRRSCRGCRGCTAVAAAAAAAAEAAVASLGGSQRHGHQIRAIDLDEAKACDSRLKPGGRVKLKFPVLSPLRRCQALCKQSVPPSRCSAYRGLPRRRVPCATLFAAQPQQRVPSAVTSLLLKRSIMSGGSADSAQNTERSLRGTLFGVSPAECVRAAQPKQPSNQTVSLSRVAPPPQSSL